ncbi:unnamed protein product [Coffea canephora]|uniref:Uncharacterized protein n=1 Tax=Coffea canephora TaxID=49390 RepID=A0A068V8F8_COFCA|nr:unnamed protein product [Coffea canephora]
MTIGANQGSGIHSLTQELLSFFTNIEAARELWGS